MTELKSKFKYISGMWPKTAKFESEEQRLQSWQTDSVIKQKIYQPAKALLICDEGADKLEQEQQKYASFLQSFRRSPSKDRSPATRHNRSDSQLRCTPKLDDKASRSNKRRVAYYNSVDLNQYNLGADDEVNTTVKTINARQVQAHHKDRTPSQARVFSPVNGQDYSLRRKAGKRVQKVEIQLPIVKD